MNLQAWADKYEETFPVISDGQNYIHSFGTKGKGTSEGPQVKLPSMTLIGPGMELLIVNKDLTEADIAPLFE